MGNWKGNYDEIRARKLTGVDKKTFEDEMAIALTEERIGFHGGFDDDGNEIVKRPSDKQGCQVVSTGNFVSEIGDYDKE